MDVLDGDELGSEFGAPSELHNEWKDKRRTRGEGQDGSVQAESRNFDESLTFLGQDGLEPRVYSRDSFQNGETEKKWRLSKELDENGCNDQSEKDAKIRPSIPLVDLFSFTDKLDHSLHHTQKKDKPELIREEPDHELVLEDKSMNFDDSPIFPDEERLEPNVCDPPDGLQNGKKERKSVKWWRWRKASGENEHDDQPIKKVSESKESTVSLLQLFSFADKLDYLLMFWGTVGAALHGAALPLVVLSFGQLLNRLGSRIDVERRVDQSALYFVWLSLVCLGSSWLEVSFWMHTGHRQAAKLRAMYLQALLQQDVGYFDTDTNTGDVVNSISTDPLALQDAISEKTGHFLHHMATFSASFIISFTSEWRIAIATLAIIPAIALPGGVYAFFLTRYNTRASSAYSEASRIVQEMQSSVDSRIIESLCVY